MYNRRKVIIGTFSLTYIVIFRITRVHKHKQQQQKKAINLINTFSRFICYSDNLNIKKITIFQLENQKENKAF